MARLVPDWLDGLSGNATLEADLTGTATHPEFHTTIDPTRVRWADMSGEEPVAWVRDLEVEGRIDGIADTLTANLILRAAATEADGETGAPAYDASDLAYLDITLPVDLDLQAPGLRADGHLRGDLVIPPGDLARYSRVSRSIPALDGGASAKVHLDGALLDPRIVAGALVELRAPHSEETLRLEADIVRTPAGEEACARLERARRGAGTAEGSDCGLGTDDGALEVTVGVLEGLTRRAELLATGRDHLEPIIASTLVPGADAPDWDDPGVYADRVDARLEVVELPLDRLGESLGLPVRLEGQLEGAAVVKGELLHPRAFADLSLQDGALGEVRTEAFRVVAGRPFTDDDSAVSFTDQPGRLPMEIGGDLTHPASGERGMVYIGGTLPVNLDLTGDTDAMLEGPIDLRLDMELPVALATVFDAGIDAPTGHMAVNGSILGTFAEPNPSVDARFAEGSGFTYAPVGVRFDGLDMAIGATREAVTLDHLYATTRSGRGVRRLFGDVTGDLRGRGADKEATDRNVVVQGEARLDRWSVTGLDAEMTLQRALVADTPDATLRLSTPTPLTVGGDLAFPRITGDVRVDESDVFLDYASTVGGGPTELDPRITLHRDGATTSTEVDEASLFDDLSIEVGVDLGRATRGRLTMPLESLQWLGNTITTLARVDVEARLAGEVVYRQLPCRRFRGNKAVPIPGRQGQCGLYHPRMQGVINIVEGNARVAASDFTLSESRVIFSGGEVYNPSLDIQGTMDAEEITLNMGVTGTAYDPTVDFSSPDTDQIFLTLLAGRPIDELSSQDAVSLIANIAFQSVLSGVNLPAVSIAPSGDIRIGLAVAKDVYAEVILAGSPRPDENSYQLQAEIGLFDNLLLRLGNGDVIPFWGDLLFEREFD